MPLSNLNSAAKDLLQFKDPPRSAFKESRKSEPLFPAFESSQIVRENRSNKDFNAISKNLSSPTEELRVLEEFSAICRLAAKQQNTIGAAKEGLTNSLELLLNKVRTSLDLMEPDEKNALGLADKNPADITHYDLMEIGLFGKVSDKKDKTIEQIKTLHQNMEEIYSNKHAPLDNGMRFGVNQEGLPDKIKSGRESQITADALFNNKLAITTIDTPATDTKIEKRKTTQVLNPNPAPPNQQDPEQISSSR